AFHQAVASVLLCGACTLSEHGEYAAYGGLCRGNGASGRPRGRCSKGIASMAGGTFVKRRHMPLMQHIVIPRAFNGTLVLPKNVVAELGLPVESIAEAILANGELVELETYGCSIHWLGKVYDTQVVTNESEYGLIGTGLLVDRVITVDYKAKTVSVD
ncbi:MAG: hypothetical protein ACKO3P_11145, partial [Planctomycetaceae bacterium]